MQRLAMTALTCLSCLAPSVSGEPLAPATDPQRAVALPDACTGTGGLVRDDGTAETGYGWVPSVVEGVYVQEVTLTDLASRELESVCVCWLRITADDTLDFDVVFYLDNDGEPQLQPFASIPASAAGVPAGVTGRFYEVDVSGIELTSQTTYVGVRWSPSVDGFFFVCADHTPAGDPVPGFFIDDRADGWGDVLDTLDPIFDDHHAMLVRLRTAPGVTIPVLPGPGLVLFGLALAAAGLWQYRRS